MQVMQCVLSGGRDRAWRSQRVGTQISFAGTLGRGSIRKPSLRALAPLSRMGSVNAATEAPLRRLRPPLANDGRAVLVGYQQRAFESTNER